MKRIDFLKPYKGMNFKSKTRVTKPLAKIISLVCIVILSAVFQGCEKEDDFSYENNQYLEIQNINKKTYSQEEKDILLKVEQRISENIKIENGKMTLSHTCAEELNIEPSLFEIFNFVILNSNIAPKYTLNHMIRLKSGGIEEENTDRGIIGDIIYENCGSEIEQECFDNYWSGGGYMELSENAWSGVSSYSESIVGSGFQDGEQVIISGSIYYKNSVSFYDNPEYDCAFGTATVYFDIHGNAVGFSDYYDFNSLPWGERSIVAEIGTRTIGALGEAHGAMDYSIEYGIQE